MVTFVRDWSQWDESYEYVVGKLPGYLENNLGLDAWKATKTDIIAVYGLDRVKRFSGRFDKASNTVIADEIFPERASLDAPYLCTGPPTDYVKGFIDSPHGVYLIASTPILRSDASGPSRGSFIMGRLIDSAFETALAEQTSVSTSLKRVRDGSSGIDIGELLTKDRILITAKSSIRSFGLVRDLWKTPVLIIASETPREIGAWGRETMRVSGYLIVSLGIAFCLIMLLLLSRLFLHPLSEIRSHIRIFEMDEGARMPQPLLTRADEIGELASSFQHMSESLDARDRELRAANENLETKVQDRTRDLAKVSDDLRLMAKVVESTGDAVVITDLDANILIVNEAFSKCSGYSREELIGQNTRILKSDRHDVDFYKRMWERLLAEDTWTGEIWDKKKTGEIYPKWLTINVVRQDDGLPRWYVGVSSDISRIKETEERLNQLAYFDPLTALPNRSLFQDRLERAILRSKRYEYKLALLFIDLDRFKIVNDAMGHATGDQLLIEAARRISRRVRESDTVCRLGGDEFTVILDHVGKGEQAAIVADNIIEELGKPIILNEREVFIGASIGIAIHPEDDDSAEGLTRKADAAMYLAKAAGRDTFRFVSDETEATSQARLTLESELRRAVEREEFVLHYQPLVSLGDGRVIGAEALVRWRKNGALVMPGSFIALSEETGLILKLGDWVLVEACKAAKRWHLEGMPLAVSVNFSSRQFERAGLTRLINEILTTTGLPPELLVAEITETAVMADVTTAQRTMNELQEIGIKIAIDDFGTGYSSLSYLSRFPVDKLKIDQSFVRGIETGSGKAMIVDAVIAMSKSLGLGTLAEGIETQAQRGYLETRGCDEAQGYLFSRPVEERDFIQYAMLNGGTPKIVEVS